MIYPKFLKDGGTIGVPAPSAGSEDVIRNNRYDNAIKYFKDNDYKVEISKNLYKNIYGRSADKITRAKELNDMFASDLDFILCASGGEFLVECLPYVDFELLKNTPKFVAGFSDPTGILYPLTTKYDIATIYGNNFTSFGRSRFDQNHYDFLDLIKGKRFEFNSYPFYEEEKLETITGLEPYNLTEPVEWKTLDNKNVKIEGRIIGGCFDVIFHLIGTKYDGFSSFQEKYKNDGIIWVFDNCEQSLDETIRILWNMNEAGYFKYVKGVIFGRFGNTNSYCGYDVKTCLQDSVLAELNIPVIYDADISHKSLTMPILMGSIATVECKNRKGKISFKMK